MKGMDNLKHYYAGCLTTGSCLYLDDIYQSSTSNGSKVNPRNQMIVMSMKVLGKNKDKQNKWLFGPQNPDVKELKISKFITQAYYNKK